MVNSDGLLRSRELCQQVWREVAKQLEQKEIGFDDIEFAEYHQ